MCIRDRDKTGIRRNKKQEPGKVTVRRSCLLYTSLLLLLQVTSFAEVWIEITSLVSGITSIAVTSFAEVWIEIVVTNPIKGLVIVTSFAEVWIEMSDLMGHLIRH